MGGHWDGGGGGTEGRERRGRGEGKGWTDQGVREVVVDVMKAANQVIRVQERWEEGRGMRGGQYGCRVG